MRPMADLNMSVNVSALRAQLEDKLGSTISLPAAINNTNNNHQQHHDSEVSKLSHRVESQPSVAFESKRPKPPVHRKPSSSNNTSPPVPPHHRPSHLDMGSEHCDAPPEIPPPKVSLKPPIPPKPRISTSDSRRTSASGGSDISRVPSSLMDDSDRQNGNDDLESVASVSASMDTLSVEEDHHTAHADSNESSVRDRVKAFEDSSFVLGKPPVIILDSSASRAERPKSTISSDSGKSMDNDSDSDSGDERPAELLRRDNHELLSPNARLNTRRSSAACFNGDPAVHDRIMNELKRNGVVRGSHHVKKSTEKLSDDAATPTTSNGIPDDIGRMRMEKKARKADATSSSLSSDGTDSRATSMLSDRSSTMTAASSEPEIREYNTGDPQEDKRLRSLYHAANEFYTVQKAFVKYLRDMIEVYPGYLVEYGRAMQKDVLTTNGSEKKHIVMQVQHELSQLKPLHETMLADFKNNMDKWDSMEPCMADIVLKYAPLLKFCTQFLKLKSNFVTELTALRGEDRDFDNATVAFEQKIFKRGVGAVVQQLDQVHQNFMRYKILMMSYKNYLIEGSEEFVKTETAIRQLETVTQTVNEAMGLPSNEQLRELFYKFTGEFDVFLPGRRLILESAVEKQTRKGWQDRYIVLFTDVLWICRTTSKMGAGGVFDMRRSYQIQLELVATEANDHEDYECNLAIRSQTKSCVIRFSNVQEREKWNAAIRKARQEKKDYTSRLNKSVNKMIETPKRDPNSRKHKVIVISDGEGSPAKSSTSGSRRSRSNSADCASAPHTPVKDVAQPELRGCDPSEPSRQDSKKKYRRGAEKVQAVWVPDNDSTTCLMSGCSSEFSFLNRRHHCRNCGWLICKDCSGKAPIYKAAYKKDIVCPECFDLLIDAYMHGDLFPVKMLHQLPDGTCRIRYVRPKTNELVLVDPKTLFEWPKHRHLKRLNMQSRTTNQDGITFGKVYWKNHRNQEQVRYAQLDEGARLRFFKAAMDVSPVEEYVIYGFLLEEKKQSDDSVIFELTHRNQITTDRKEQIISFRVEKKSVQKWSNALRTGLDLGEV